MFNEINLFRISCNLILSLSIVCLCCVQMSQLSMLDICSSFGRYSTTMNFDVLSLCNCPSGQCHWICSNFAWLMILQHPVVSDVWCVSNWPCGYVDIVSHSCFWRLNNFNTDLYKWIVTACGQVTFCASDGSRTESISKNIVDTVWNCKIYYPWSGNPKAYDIWSKGLPS